MRLALLLLMVALGACTLLTSFDPEEQPCDKAALRPEDQCLAGYHCEGDTCRRGAFDAGQ